MHKKNPTPKIEAILKIKQCDEESANKTDLSFFNVFFL